MSINHFFDKIKGVGDIDRTTLLYLLVVLGVGVSAFGLGRLSVDPKNSNPTPGVVISDNMAVLNQASSYDSVRPSQKNEAASSSQTSPSSFVKRYVASKNGKLYYASGCSGAKRIAPKNEVWFATSSDAEKSGYKPSPSCK